MDAPLICKYFDFLSSFGLEAGIRRYDEGLPGASPFSDGSQRLPFPRVPMPHLNETVRDAARHSVLCWLATADADGLPNVSPKEVWAIADDEHVVVAHIVASSYRFYPDETTETSQVLSALQTYGVEAPIQSRRN